VVTWVTHDVATRTGGFALQITPAEHQTLQLLAQGKSLMAEAVESAKCRGLLCSGQDKEGEGNDD
jgi:hypothetical protein